jgi:hypothetical protein
VEGVISDGHLYSDLTAPAERVSHSGQNLIDRDLVIAVAVARRTLGSRNVAEGDVHHREQLGDGDDSVSRALADTCRPQPAAHGDLDHVLAA